MKDVRYIRKEKGVSPVIATILMVAITVVLAATVYIMVSGLGTTATKRLTGSLTFLSDVSTISGAATDNATFEITLSQPSNPKVSDLTVKLLDASGSPVTGFNWGIIHITSDSTHVKSGDRLYVTGVALGSGYQVIITITGYDGTITGTIP